MANKLYLWGTTPATISPAFSGIWATATTGNAVRRLADISGGGGTFETVTTPSAATTGYRLVGQFISKLLATQTISGTVSGVVLGSESAAAANAGSAIAIRVFTTSGTQRGVLLPFFTGLSYAAAPNEYTTTLTASFTPSGSATITNLAVTSGDYFVIELGAAQTAASAATISQRYGATGLTDIAFLQTGTNQFANPWISFSQNLFFQSPWKTNGKANLVSGFPRHISGIGRLQNSQIKHQLGKASIYTAVYTTLATDNFNRANEFPLSQSGKWGVFDNTFPPASNYCEVSGNSCSTTSVTSDNATVYTGIALPPNQYVQCKILDTSAINSTTAVFGPGPMARCAFGTTTAQSGYIVGVGTNAIALYKANGNLQGGVNVLASGNITYVSGQTVRLETVGSGVKVFYNNVQILSVFNTAFTTGVGGIYMSAFVNSHNSAIDDWEAGSVLYSTARSSYPISGLSRVKVSQPQKQYAKANIYIYSSIALASDNFNRANESPLSKGGKWGAGINAQFNLTNQQAVSVSSTDACSVYSGLSFSNNQYSEITLGQDTSVLGGGGGIGPAIRMAAQNSAQPTGFLMLFEGTTGSPNVTLYGEYSGGFHVLSTTHITYASGNTARLEILGSNIRGYYSGVKIFDIINASSPIGTFPGIYSEAFPAGINNWTGGNIVQTIGRTATPIYGRGYVFSLSSTIQKISGIGKIINRNTYRQYAKALITAVNPYITSFSLTENPISERGFWINGNTQGLDWANVQTMSGGAYGTQDGAGNFDDSTALISGIWSNDQTAVGRLKLNRRPTGSVIAEIEFRFRSKISGHYNAGYECNFSLLSGAGAYVQHVIWSGASGAFGLIDSRGGVGFQVNDGDELKATIIGNVLTTYINGVQALQSTDNTWQSGQVGIGMFINNTNGIVNNSDFGWDSFTGFSQYITFSTRYLKQSGISRIKYTDVNKILGKASINVPVSTTTTGKILGHSRILPSTYVVLASDNFNRSNGILNTGNWTATADVFNSDITNLYISGNQVIGSTGVSFVNDSVSVYNQFGNIRDQWSEIYVSGNGAVGGGLGGGAIVRAFTGSSSLTSFYQLTIDNSSATNQNCLISKHINGSYYNLAQVTFPITPSGGRLRLEVSGQVNAILNAYFNDTLIISGIVDSGVSIGAVLTSGYPGISYSDQENSQVFMDDWLGGTFNTGTFVSRTQKLSGLSRIKKTNVNHQYAIASIAANGFQSVAVDAISSGVFSYLSGLPSGITSFSWNHTCSGINRYLTVGVGIGAVSNNDASINISSVTYNGVNLTPIAIRHAGDQTVGYAQLFGLTSPETGTHQITVNLNAAFNLDIEAGAISFINVDQTSPTGLYTSNATTGNTISTSLPSTGVDMVVDLAVGDGFINSSNQTLAWKINQNNGLSLGCNAAMSYAQGSGLTTMGYNLSANDGAAIVALDIRGITPAKKIYGISRIQVHDTQKQHALGRIQVHTPNKINGLARIQFRNANKVNGLSRIQVHEPQKQNGLARIRNSIVNKINGVARVKISSIDKINGLARITTRDTKKQNGISRITFRNSQKINGLARIRNSVISKIYGQARIKQTSPLKINGISRVSVRDTNKISGLGKILLRNTDKVYGLSRITSREQYRVYGIARIATTGTVVHQYGLARIRNSVVRKTQGISRITVRDTNKLSGISRIAFRNGQKIYGSARIRSAVVQKVYGLARIQIHTTAKQNAKSRILVTDTNKVLGRANVYFNRINKVNGLSRIQVHTSNKQNGLARITSREQYKINGLARIKVSSINRVYGIARIQLRTVRTINGLARIRNSVIQKIYGIATIIVQGTTNHLNHGIARIRNFVPQKQHGLSRITKTDTNKTSGIARISLKDIQKISGISRILLRDSNHVYGQARVKVSGPNKVYGLARILNTSIVKTHGLARIKVSDVNKIYGIASIRNSVSQKQHGLARVSQREAQRVYGLARITARTTQKISGIARVSYRNRYLSHGLGRVQVSGANKVYGLARILVRDAKKTSGLARIRTSVIQKIYGIANIRQLGSNIYKQYGLARIRATTTQKQHGIGRIEISSVKKVSGIARVTFRGSNKQTALARVRNSVTQRIYGLARIQIRDTKTILGKASILVVTRDTKTINGIARIKVSDTNKISGVARITQRNTVAQHGIARLRRTDVNRLQGIARILARIAQKNYGFARIQTKSIQKVSGKGYINSSSARHIYGISKIFASYQKTILGLGSVRNTVTHRIYGVTRIGHVLNKYTIYGKCRIITIQQRTPKEITIPVTVIPIGAIPVVVTPIKIPIVVIIP